MTIETQIVLALSVVLVSLVGILVIVLLAIRDLVQRIEEHLDNRKEYEDG